MAFKRKTAKDFLKSGKKLSEIKKQYKEELKKQMKKSNQYFQKINTAIDREIGKIIWENANFNDEEKEETTEADLEFVEEITAGMTEEEIRKAFFMPSKYQVWDFYGLLIRLCKKIGKDKLMDLLIKYAVKVAKLRKEFSQEVYRYASALYEFAYKFKKNIFDARIVRLWLYNKQHWENFVIGALQQVHQEYLFDELNLKLA